MRLHSSHGRECPARSTFTLVLDRSYNAKVKPIIVLRNSLDFRLVNFKPVSGCAILRIHQSLGFELLKCKVSKFSDSLPPRVIPHIVVSNPDQFLRKYFKPIVTSLIFGTSVLLINLFSN